MQRLTKAWWLETIYSDMLLRFVIRLFVITSFLSCSKEYTAKPYGFLNLRVDGQEENIKWETILSQWIDTAGTIDLDTTSYYFDRCNIHLKNITSQVAINSPSLIGVALLAILNAVRIQNIKV